MSYIALYRKYRPSTFDSIVGQENITQILKNQIKTHKVSHAYIFSGSRGTGKTSAAKVFARAINCLNPKDGEPCNECEVCKNILEGNITDVIEMDAASNNSVENIRQIRQEVVYATIDVKYRVYIIDEVHMLTTSAFNALLKTLEEPPENVVFILATTEQHKIPVTILSRCLRFEFNRIPDNEIVNRLEYVLNEENIKYELEAIEYIAKLAEGGLRDALSILERCISEYKDVLKYEDVLRIVGAIDKQVIEEIVNNILKQDSISCLTSIDEMVQKGRDLRQLVYQLVEKFLNILIDNPNDLNKDRIIKIIDRLSKLDNELKQTAKPVIVLKSCIIEICNIINLSDFTSTLSSNINEKVLGKISKLEKEIEILSAKLLNNTNLNNTKVDTIINNKRKETVKNVDNIVNNSNASVDNIQVFNEADTFKKTVVEQGKLKLYSSLAAAKIYTNDTSFVIITDNSFAYNILKTEESINDLSSILLNTFNIGKTILVKLSEQKNESINKVEKLFKENDINYTKMD